MNWLARRFCCGLLIPLGILLGVAFGESALYLCGVSSFCYAAQLERRPAKAVRLILRAYLSDYQRQVRYIYELELDEAPPSDSQRGQPIELGQEQFFKLYPELRFWEAKRGCYGYMGAWGEDFNFKCNSQEVLDYTAQWKKLGFRLVGQQKIKVAPPSTQPRNY